MPAPPLLCDPGWLLNLSGPLGSFSVKWTSQNHLAGRAEGVRVAVVLRRAKANQLLPLLCIVSGITQREVLWGLRCPWAQRSMPLAGPRSSVQEASGVRPQGPSLRGPVQSGHDLAVAGDVTHVVTRVLSPWATGTPHNWNHTHRKEEAFSDASGRACVAVRNYTEVPEVSHRPWSLEGRLGARQDPGYLLLATGRPLSMVRC